MLPLPHFPTNRIPNFRIESSSDNPITLSSYATPSSQWIVRLLRDDPNIKLLTRDLKELQIELNFEQVNYGILLTNLDYSIAENALLFEQMGLAIPKDLSLIELIKNEDFINSNVKTGRSLKEDLRDLNQTLFPSLLKISIEIKSLTGEIEVLATRLGLDTKTRNQLLLQLKAWATCSYTALPLEQAVHWKSKNESDVAHPLYFGLIIQKGALIEITEKETVEKLQILLGDRYPLESIQQLVSKGKKLKKEILSIAPDYSMIALVSAIKELNEENVYDLDQSDICLQDPVSLEPFKDPLTLSCGHTFSAETISELKKHECPLCRQEIKEEKTIKANRLIGAMSLIPISKPLSMTALEEMRIRLQALTLQKLNLDKKYDAIYFTLSKLEKFLEDLEEFKKCREKLSAISQSILDTQKVLNNLRNDRANYPLIKIWNSFQNILNQQWKFLESAPSINLANRAISIISPYIFSSQFSIMNLKNIESFFERVSRIHFCYEKIRENFKRIGVID